MKMVEPRIPTIASIILVLNKNPNCNPFASSERTNKRVLPEPNSRFVNVEKLKKALESEDSNARLQVRTRKEG